MTISPLSPRTQQAYNAVELYQSVTPGAHLPSDSVGLARRVAKLAQNFPAIVVPNCSPCSPLTSSPGNTLDPNDEFMARNIEIICGPDQDVGVIFRGPKPIAMGTHKKVFSGVFFKTQRENSGVGPVHHVAIAKTIPGEISAGKAGIDYNGREYNFLLGCLPRPFPGLVKVLAVRKDLVSSAAPDLTTHFTAVYPYCAADLFTMISEGSIRSHLSEKAIFELQRTSVDALSKFHATGMVHRDIKPENLLVAIDPPQHLAHLSKTDPQVLGCPDTRFSVSICDPSFAKYVDEKIQGEGTPGTVQYLSPEGAFHIKNKKPNGDPPPGPFDISQESEVFSLGLVLLALQDPDLFYKVAPFNQFEELRFLGYSEAQALRVFTAQYADYYTRGRIPGFREPEDKNSILHIIWRMLHPRPEMRSPMKEVSEKFEGIAKEKFPHS